ncbi:uncharacterized protein K452DRAFT_362462 [Aplosporella prunicola CBS 121167]|uniref:Uncharacterized protein n=1 Tax=Aplosporella prunicola CBS 121167 TaxID=1176127 RepID=A0A6A6AX69_9PEZI|nr:uncharacterized protein K452DRAFT_362462 [Aplosporella prunicola CBS 121167]KAF2136529.1 hypothetical protein K452DRAFT_362462 [Aplosporella prunicola CBS 121167]
MSTPPSHLLLRLSPLLTSTASLTFTFCEHLYLAPYLSLRPATTAPNSNPDHQAGGTSRGPDPNVLLPIYIDRWFRPAFSVILTLYPLTWATAIANLATTASSRKAGLSVSTPSGALYLAGLALSAAHMLWGLRAKGLLDAIRSKNNSDLLVDGAAKRVVAETVTPEEEGDSRENNHLVDGRDSVAVLAAWIQLNTWRGVLADLPAWVCFFVGFLLSES